MTYTEEYYRTGNYANYFQRAESVERMAQEINHFLGTISFQRKRALDFGCGPGFFASGLRQCGWDVTGYDISEWAIEQARIRDNRTHFTSYLPADIYDLAFAFDVLEHLTPDEVADVLQGTLTSAWFVRIPVCETDGGRYVLDISEQDPTHNIRWTKIRWRSTFAKAGFLEMVRPNLATIWDSRGVMVSLLARS